VTDAPALLLEGISHSFGATRALRDVTLRLTPGSVHALLGENGAGKTTLMRIAYGMLRPDAGHVSVRGIGVRMSSPSDAIAAGIGMVHQHYTNVPEFTVAENVALGGHGRLDLVSVRDDVRRLARDVGVTLDPDARVGDLSVGSQQRLEIVKALARHARVLILDEPTAALAPGETAELLRWMRHFASTGGSVVLITHRLQDARTVADQVTVLRAGAVTAAGPVTGMDTDALARAMLGQQLSGAPVRQRRDRAAGEAATGEAGAAGAAVVVTARDLCVEGDRGHPAVSAVSFAVMAGEVVGVAGVEGAGHQELLEAIAGRRAVSSGQLQAPADVAFIPEDRHRDALVLDMPLRDNVALRGAGDRRGTIDAVLWDRQTDDLLAQGAVRGGGRTTPARSLSGGNQQRLVVARELAGEPPLVVAINPTRGLDVHAAATVLQRLLQAADRGAAVLVYSSDLDEVLPIADRLLVAHAGTITESPLDRDTAGALMLGVR
jgi:general nucleoside transport system ATP-binding protein